MSRRRRPETTSTGIRILRRRSRGTQGRTARQGHRQHPAPHTQNPADLGSGEELRLRVENRTERPLSLHWHGVRNQNPMDGVGGVTQAPIAPGASFSKTFTSAGSFPYHCTIHPGMVGTVTVQ